MILSWDKARLAFMQDASTYEPQYYSALWQAISEGLPGKPLHICDAGCGAGYLSLEMAKHCAQVTAVDLSADATDLLRKNAASVDNLTVKTGDIRALAPETPYDAMVFCYFGKTPEILRIAKQQCAGTLVMVTRNYTHHRFSLHPTAFDRDTADYCRGCLEEAGIPYDCRLLDLEFGQPFRSLDAAAEFFTIYGGTPAKAEEVLPKLQKTDDPVFPYYLPSTKKMAVVTVRTADLP